MGIKGMRRSPTITHQAHHHQRLIQQKFTPPPPRKQPCISPSSPSLPSSQPTPWPKQPATLSHQLCQPAAYVSYSPFPSPIPLSSSLHPPTPSHLNHLSPGSLFPSHLTPPHQIPCIQSASSDLGCPTDDYACRCSNADAISGAAIGCVVDSCGFLQALEVQASASAVCGCVATAAPDAKRMVRGMGW